MKTINVRSRQRCQMIEITSEVAAFVQASELRDGTVVIYVPHTTAGVTINENADPDVVHDVLMTLEELFPQHRPGYRHAEGNSDSHVKASLIGSSATVLVESGKPVLGTWQGVYFCEFDGPRTRQVHLYAHPTKN